MQQTWAMNICRRHFLKLRISVQTCSSTWRVLATCSAGTIRQCPGTKRPLLQQTLCKHQQTPAKVYDSMCSSSIPLW